MEIKSTLTGLGQPVGLFIRVLAAIIGLAGLVTLVLHAVLIYVGAPGYFLDLRDLPEILTAAMFAAYGFSIAFRGKTPAGILPWK